MSKVAAPELFSHARGEERVDAVENGVVELSLRTKRD